MKSLVIYLAIVGLCFTQMLAQDKQMQKEIQSTINALVKSTAEKDIDGCMKFWLNSEDLVYIADGKEYDINQVRELYTEFFNNLESLNIHDHTVSVTPIGQYKACCIWRGTETYKMKEKETIDTRWVSTLILENKKGGWVIVHGHSSHF